MGNSWHQSPFFHSSYLQPSILFALFSYFLRFIVANMFASYKDPEYSDSNNNNNYYYYHMLKYTSLLLAVELSFLFISVVISDLFSTATVLVSAFSYAGAKLDWKDLFSCIEQTWKKPLSRRFYSYSSSSSSFLLIAFVLAVILVFTYPNFITICAAVIFGIVVFILLMYSLVASFLSVVVSIVEDSSRVEALEKAEKLVKGGQRLHGFMLNLFFYLVAVILISPVSYYYIYKFSVNKFTISYGVFFLYILASLLNMVVLMAYTVFYFRCTQHHVR